MRRLMASRPCLRTMSFMTRRRSSTSRPRRRFRRYGPGDISLPHAGNETRKLPRKIAFHELRSDCSDEGCYTDDYILVANADGTGAMGIPLAYGRQPAWRPCVAHGG